MDQKNTWGFATRQIHAGKQDNSAGALCTPIYQTSTFAFDSVSRAAPLRGEEPGYIYTRLANPSLAQVEEKLASLEGGEAALATASGMGAISAALWSSVESGDEIVAHETLYGCTYSLLSHGLTKFGVTSVLTDLSDLENLKNSLTPKTRVVYFETPCNPTMEILDIEAIAQMVHSYKPRYPGDRGQHLLLTLPPSVLWSWAPTWWSTAPPSIWNGARRRHRRCRGGQQGVHRYLPDVRSEGYDRVRS